MSRKLAIFLVVIVAVLALDQGTKVWVRHALAPPAGAAQVQRAVDLDRWCSLSTRQVRVIDGFFDICYSENTGVAFGLGKQVPPAVWVGVGVVALALISLFLRQTGDDQRALTVALALVGGGALGNIIDRVVFGHVTDFVVWHWHEHAWPTFNVADAALVSGVILMFLTMGKQGKESAAEEPHRRRPSRSKAR